MPNETTKRRSKDSVFVDLFTNTEYVLRLLVINKMAVI